MAVSKKIRFEVFKRDKFTCQYCGRSAPDVVLHADHIHPKSKGGADDITNLITSCFDCNMGKKDRTLDDNTAMEKRKKQLDDLQGRREQLEMMMQWHQGLVDIENDVIAELETFWIGLATSWSNLTDSGRASLKKWVSKYGVNAVLDAMKVSATQYIILSDNREEQAESTEKAFIYIPRICASNEKSKDKPYLKKLYYIRGILKNRLSYFNQWKCIEIMEAAVLSGTNIEAIEDTAKCVNSWSQFVTAIEAITINTVVHNEW